MLDRKIIRKMLHYLEKGMTIPDVADKVKLHPSTVARNVKLCRTHGIEYFPTSGRRKKIKPEHVTMPLVLRATIDSELYEVIE